MINHNAIECIKQLHLVESSICGIRMHKRQLLINNIHEVYGELTVEI